MKKFILILFVVLLTGCFIGYSSSNKGTAVIVNQEGREIGSTSAYYTRTSDGKEGLFVMVEKMPDGSMKLWRPR